MGHAPRLWLFVAALAASPAAAQNQGLVVRDGTLGSAPQGVVAPGVDDLGQPAEYLIRGDLGEQRGGNLFHSFSKFSIGSGERATFTGQGAPDPGAIDNVISRVTGGDPSEIRGTLRSTIPDADMWLLNPSGVVFGEGARLDVPGSFHASTGDYVGFGEGDLVRFYADPSRESVLSTARPEAFGFLGESAAAPITVTGATLAVPDRAAVELVGGDVTLTSATLDAPGGAVSIRGGKIVVEEGSRVLAENAGDDPAGTITVAANESLLADNSLLSVSTSSAGDAGTIELRGGDLHFRNGPGLPHGFSGDPYDPTKVPVSTSVGAAAETLGSGAGGGIEIDAVSVEVTDGAGLSAQTVGAAGADGVHAEASGDGGSLDIEAGTVQIANRGFLSVDSWGSRGDAGTIDITADSLTLDALDPRTGQQTLTPIGAENLVAPGRYPGHQMDVPPTPGRAGTIAIKAGSIEVKNGDDGGGHIATSCVRCAGGAGEIQIEVETMSVDGSIVASNQMGSGGAGEIRIEAETMSVVDGFIVASNHMGSGGAGEIRIEAKTMSVDGGIFASSHMGSSGPGGYIRIDADTLVIESRWISTETRDEGTISDAGDIEIHAGKLSVRGAILAYTWEGSSGDAGTITIDADSIEILEGGGVNASTFNGSTGDAGTITIAADSLLVHRVGPEFESSIFAGSQGSGDAGTIAIDADSVVIAPGGTISASADVGSSGDAGSVTIRTDTLHIGPDPDVAPSDLSGRAFISASSVGAGKAGSIHVEATDSIFVTSEGGERFSLARAVAPGPFEPFELRGIFSVTVLGGDGGPITLAAPDITVTDGAILSSGTVGGGRGSDVLLRGERIHIVNGGVVSSVSLPFGTFTGPIPGGPAGSVTFEATESIEVAGRHPEFGDPSRVATGTVGSGEAGAIVLQAPQLLVDGGFVTTTAVPARRRREAGAGGDITLVADDLLVGGGGRVDASTFVGEPGGRVEVAARKSIVVEGEESGIASRTGGGGSGGEVALRAPAIEVNEGGEVSARSAQGFDEVGDLLAIVAELLPPTAPEATGNAGAVTLAADKVRLAGGTIATNAEAADGGNVTIEAKELVHLDAGEITATVTGGTGGNLTIDPDVVILQNGSQIVARASTGEGGNIQITADNYFAFPGTVVDASSDLGIDGVVQVHAPDVNLAGKITALPTTLLDAASLMKERCAARRTGKRAGSFAVRGNGGIPPEPDGWLPASVGLEAASTPAAGPPALVPSLPGSLLAAGMPVGVCPGFVRTQRSEP